MGIHYIPEIEIDLADIGHYEDLRAVILSWLVSEKSLDIVGGKPYGAYTVRKQGTVLYTTHIFAQAVVFALGYQELPIVKG